METPKIKLLAIVGPTASGKTSLSIKIAKQFSGEIIAADSRTIYKGLDIGTAKPTNQEQDGIIHHGLDLIGPDQDFTAADFKKYADSKIKDINKRDKLPIVVGGTGLYVDSVLYDFSFINQDKKLKTQLDLLSNKELLRIIKEKNLVNPENIQNKLHLINTILRNGKLPNKQSLPSTTIIIGISPPKDVLKKRITDRATDMVNKGVIDEIKKAEKIYGWNSRAMTGGIYRALKPSMIDGQSYDDAINSFINSDIKLAKRQMTWFGRNPDIKWFNDDSTAYLWLINHFKGKL